MSSGDPTGGGPLSEVAYGVTRALLDRLWKGLANIPDRIANREIAFIGDPATRKRVKERMRSAEYARLRRYVGDSGLWPVVATGLAFRELEGKPAEAERLAYLRDVLHGTQGGRIAVQMAEIVQRGMLTDLIGYLEKEGQTEEQIKGRIGALLSDLMAHVEFVQTAGNSAELARKLLWKVGVSSPQIVMGRGWAGGIVRRAASVLERSPACHCELHESDGQTYLLLFRADQWDGTSTESPRKTK